MVFQGREVLLSPLYHRHTAKCLPEFVHAVVKMKVSILIIGVMSWLGTTQNIVKALEDDDGSDITEGEAKQKYYRLSQFSNLLAAAPILAKGDGEPLALGPTTAEEIAGVVQDILGQLATRPTARWESISLIAFTDRNGACGAIARRAPNCWGPS